MKKYVMAVVAFAGINLGANAQLDLPQPSPKAELEQQVGLTEIEIEYSSPGVKGREGKIWGGLVPYGEVWRMGANQSTKISFDNDVRIDGKILKEGSYSLGAIPGKDEWTIIFSNEDQGGWGNYNKEDDALRIKVKPEDSDFNERLLFTITDFNNEKATVNMEWEKAKVSFDVNVDTKKQAAENIKNALEPNWRTYANAARYMWEEEKEYDQALTLINQSIKTEKSWYNTWLKASILKDKGNKKEALTTAKEAWELGLKAEEKGENFFYKERVKKAVEEWK